MQLAKPPTQLSTDLPAPEAEPLGDDSLQVHTALKTVAAVLIAMWAGTAISAGITSLGVTLPEYIGAMLAAAILRNVDDRTRWLRAVAHGTGPAGRRGLVVLPGDGAHDTRPHPSSPRWRDRSS